MYKNRKTVVGGMMRKTESQKIALCGMLGSLSVVLLLLGSALQIGTYAAPMLAAFLLIPVLEEYGTRYALTLYVCVAILAVLFVPETALAEVRGVQRGHGAGVSFAVCAARARRAGRAAGRRRRDAGSTAGRGQPVVLAV